MNHATRSDASRLARSSLAGLAVDACEAFIRWYDITGHWIHDGRAEAARTWIERGITTLAPAPVNAAQLLADWIAADPLPVLTARLRQEEATQSVSAIWLPIEVQHDGR